MIAYYSMMFLHVLLFVYWLGGDLGTFYSSRFVSNDKLSAEARATAVRIMAGVDMGPKICMPLILAAGVALSQEIGGLEVPLAVVVLVWLGCLAWLLLVLAVHHHSGTRRGAQLAQGDLYLRFAVIGAIIGLVIYNEVAGAPIRFPWISHKLVIFAALVAAGLMIRRNLRPFGPAYAKLVTEGPSREVNAAIAGSLKRCLPWVYLIWAGLLLNAAIGMNLYNLFR